MRSRRASLYAIAGTVAVVLAVGAWRIVASDTSTAPVTPRPPNPHRAPTLSATATLPTAPAAATPTPPAPEPVQRGPATDAQRRRSTRHQRPHSVAPLRPFRGALHAPAPRRPGLASTTNLIESGYYATPPDPAHRPPRTLAGRRSGGPRQGARRRQSSAGPAPWRKHGRVGSMPTRPARWPPTHPESPTSPDTSVRSSSARTTPGSPASARPQAPTTARLSRSTLRC